MSNHTPGPWLWAMNDTKDRALITEQDGYTVIYAQTTQHSAAHDSMEANIKLIAAAPELLEVLEACQKAYEMNHIYDMTPNLFERVDAAIAKARGGERIGNLSTKDCYADTKNKNAKTPHWKKGSES